MIVRTLDSVTGTERQVFAPTWSSRRLLVADDGMGFSLHDTIIDAGTVTPMWYRNHLEAVYCIEGEGTLEEVGSGEVHEIRAGTVYALDRHDRHVLRATTQLRMVCVFNPPCTGTEEHDEYGGYALAQPDGPSDVATGKAAG